MYDECIEPWISFCTATESHTTCTDFRYDSLILILSSFPNSDMLEEVRWGGVLQILKF